MCALTKLANLWPDRNYISNATQTTQLAALPNAAKTSTRLPCSWHVLDVFGHPYPGMHALFVHRKCRRRKSRLGERPDWNRNVLFVTREFPVDRRSTLRAEVKSCPTAGIANTNILTGPATDRHIFSAKACLRTKHTAGAALTSQAVTDRDSKWPFGGCCGELSATAGCFV